MSIHVEDFEGVTEEVVGRLRELRREVYSGDGHYCMPFEGTLWRELSRPEYEGRQKIFVVRRDHTLIGCVVARRSESLTLEDRSVATLGNFEALNDSMAIRQLLEQATSWCYEEGSQLVIGPMNGDTWHDYRFNLGPRDERPFLLEPYNPAYYPEIWEECGFELLATYHSLRIDDPAAAAAEFRPRWQAAQKAGYRVETMKLERLDRALDRVYDLVCVSFSDNFLYTPIERQSFKAKYEGIDALLDDEMSFFLVDSQGDDAGFAFVFPDYSRAISAMKGKKNLWAKVKFLARRDRSCANIKTFCIAPRHRGRGLASAMAHQYYRAIAEHGFDKANICLIHDDNVGSMKMAAGYGQVLRRYGLYRHHRSE